MYVLIDYGELVIVDKSGEAAGWALHYYTSLCAFSHTDTPMHMEGNCVWLWAVCLF